MGRPPTPPTHTRLRARAMLGCHVSRPESRSRATVLQDVHQRLSDGSVEPPSQFGDSNRRPSPSQTSAIAHPVCLAAVCHKSGSSQITQIMD